MILGFTFLQGLMQAGADTGDFLEAVTKTDNVVCHFFHRDFERCKLLDKHLSILARKYFDTRFIKVSAPVSPLSSPSLHTQPALVVSSRSGLASLSCPTLDCLHKRSKAT